MQSDPTGPSTSTDPRDTALEDRGQRAAVYRKQMQVLKLLEMQLRADGLYILAYSAEELYDHVHRRLNDVLGPLPGSEDRSAPEPSQ